MYNCYNEGIKYLIDKYGAKDAPLSKFNTKSGKTFNEGKLSYVDGDRSRPVYKMSHEDTEIKLLLGQYYLGMEAKKELYYKLLTLGIIQE